MKTADIYSIVATVIVPIVCILLTYQSAPVSAIECSICRAERRDQGDWSDQAECMFWPPIPRRCGNDRFSDCFTKLEFSESNQLTGISRDCAQTNFKGCEVIEGEDGVVTKVCGWTCSSDGCNGNSLN